MIPKTSFFIYTLLFTMLFSAFAVSGQVATAQQAELSAEVTFYVH
jgi:hypothetical protein